MRRNVKSLIDHQEPFQLLLLHMERTYTYIKEHPELKTLRLTDTDNFPKPSWKKKKKELEER